MVDTEESFWTEPLSLSKIKICSAPIADGVSHPVDASRVWQYSPELSTLSKSELKFYFFLTKTCCKNREESVSSWT